MKVKERNWGNEIIFLYKRFKSKKSNIKIKSNEVSSWSKVLICKNLM
jgi:hypothetical protein